VCVCGLELCVTEELCSSLKFCSKLSLSVPRRKTEEIVQRILEQGDDSNAQISNL